MLFDLSKRNVKRSFKDYAIYFLTLSFAVCLFYVFNSVEAQTEVLQQTTGQKEMFEQLAEVLSVITIFISFVLAFLILFANQFLVKRRKAEFGTYMTLGMGRKHISRILIGETFMIGLLSLATGIGLGVLVSQGMARFTASLFDVASQDFSFVFSFSSIVKTTIYFVVIFLAVMLFNTIVISKLRLIDLIRARKQNERPFVTNLKTATILFVAAIALLISGYTLLLITPLSQMALTITSGLLIVVGVFLFFFSLASFVLAMMLKRESLYFKDLNVFIVRQLTSKMNTTFISMATISLMLTFTITILSCGFGYKHVSESELKLVAPFDATISVMDWRENPTSDPVQELRKLGVDPDQFGKHFKIRIGVTEIDARDVMKDYANRFLLDYIKDESPLPMSFISQTDYAKTMKAQGKTPVPLKKDEALFITNVPEFLDVVKGYTQNEKFITLNGKKVPLSPQGYSEMNYQTENVGRIFADVVVPDDVFNSADRWFYLINITYEGSTEEKINIENKFQDFRNATLDDFEKYGQGNISVSAMSKAVAYEWVAGETGNLIFIGIYLGIIFLISSAAILALQQLSEASDNVERFHMLGRIGVTDNMLNTALFKQILIYYLAPLSVALVNSLVIIHFINRELMGGNANTLMPSLVTLGIFLVVYGGYFLATYWGVKRIVQN
ncbi:MAG: ABC transporter permease [Bacilli bacterium]